MAVALVTGGAQGLGAAYALALRDAGHRVAIVDVDGSAIDRWSAAHPDIEALRGDVTDPDSMSAAVDSLVAAHGSIDMLVNNAGGALVPRTPAHRFGLGAWRRVVDVNLTGQWVSAAAVIPSMIEHGAGTIVNITSSVVRSGSPDGMCAYIAAKAGVVGLTRALARELGEHGITVNAVAPGYTPVETVKHVHSSEQADQLGAQMVAEQCLHRIETADDLAGVIVFLASPAAAFITGQVIHVDGGWTLR
jgi:3-oxoacyl-[acyl-carrier protein] reductase